MANIQNPFEGLSKNQRLAVGVGGVAVVGYIIYKHRQSAGSSSAPGTTATAASAYPPDGTTGNPADPYSTDPASGQTYGNEGSTYASYAPTATSSTGSSSTASSGQTPSDWIQAAENGLVNDLGYDPSTVQGAFAVWVSGGKLTPDQAAIIHAALTEFPGGPAYPINLAPTKTGSGSGSGTKAPSSAPSGLSVTPYKGFADFGWGSVSGATGYELSISGPSSADQHTSGTHAEKVVLKKGHYSAKVRANNSAGSGPWSSSHSFTVS